MVGIVVSSSSDRDDREIDEYYDNINSNGSSSTSDSESCGESGSTDELLSTETPRIPLKVF